MASFPSARALMGEWLGTFSLLATIVGSGITADRLAAGDQAMALMGNTLPTGAILVVLILVFGPISGAHFNPAVTVSLALRGEISLKVLLLYVAAQVTGAVAGVVTAHFMFEQALIVPSEVPRHGVGQLAGEFVATFGLLGTIYGCRKARPEAVPYAVGLYITAAFWFTSSQSFANPAVTIGRAMSNTYSGIEPADAVGFIVIQLLAAVLATWFFRWLADSEDPA